MRLEHVLSIALIAAMTAVLVIWNPDRHTTVIIVGLMTIGVLAPDALGTVRRRGRNRRTRQP